MAHSIHTAKSSVSLNAVPSHIALAGKNMKIWSAVVAVAVAKDIVA